MNKANGSWSFYGGIQELGLTPGNETMTEITAAMPNRSTLVYYVGAVSNVSEYPSKYGVVEVVRHSDYRITLTFTASLSVFPKYWVGSATIDGFTGWVPQATATPPEWHNAPLETGWSWTSQGRYGKDGSGKGYLIGVVNKASVATSGEAILRLPAGFRPPALWPVSFSSARGTDGSSWATYGYLWPDGYLKFHGGALPANYSLNQGIAFAAEFPAV